jgi:hypothetical protein
MTEHRWTASAERRHAGTAAAGVAGGLVLTFWAGALGIMVAGALAVVTAALLIRWRVAVSAHARDRVVVTSEGLELHSAGEPVLVGWSEITALIAVRAREHVWVGRRGFGGATKDDERTPRWSFLVRRADTTVVTVDERWEEFGKLARTIDKRVRARLVPPFRAEIVAGRTVRFGAIAVSPEGVSYEGRLLAWDDVKEFRIEQGQVVVIRKPAGRFAAADIRAVENATTLLELAAWAPKALSRDTYREASTA